MAILLESIIVLAVLYFVYRAIFTNYNPLGLSKIFAIAILFVAFLVVPITIKLMILIIVVTYFLIKKALHNDNLKEIENND